MKIQTDYELLMARVESGELGLPNLVEMILNERARNAVLVDAVREWQVLYNEAVSWEKSIDGMPDWDTIDLIELILWLALPWGDNDPLFPESDGWTPQALAANVRMKQTWQQVVRGVHVLSYEETKQVLLDGFATKYGDGVVESPGAVPEEKGVAHGNESIS